MTERLFSPDISAITFPDAASLIIGYDKDGKVLVASELKALEGQCDHYEPFLPGHYYYSKNPGMKRYYTRDWFEYAAMQKKYQIDDTQKAEAHCLIPLATASAIERSSLVPLSMTSISLV